MGERSSSITIVAAPVITPDFLFWWLSCTRVRVVCPACMRIICDLRVTRFCRPQSDRNCNTSMLRTRSAGLFCDASFEYEAPEHRCCSCRELLTASPFRRLHLYKLHAFCIFWCL